MTRVKGIYTHTHIYICNRDVTDWTYWSHKTDTSAGYPGRSCGVSDVAERHAPRGACRHTLRLLARHRHVALRSAGVALGVRRPGAAAGVAEGVAGLALGVVDKVGCWADWGVRTGNSRDIIQYITREEQVCVATAH